MEYAENYLNLGKILSSMCEKKFRGLVFKDWINPCDAFVHEERDPAVNNQ